MTLVDARVGRKRHLSKARRVPSDLERITRRSALRPAGATSRFVVGESMPRAVCVLFVALSASALEPSDSGGELDFASRPPRYDEAMQQARTTRAL